MWLRLLRIKLETPQNKCKITNENRKTVLNNPNQSLLWDGIDLPVPDLSKLTNPHSDKEVFCIMVVGCSVPPLRSLLALRLKAHCAVPLPQR